jgi:hypothetical protein
MNKFALRGDVKIPTNWRTSDIAHLVQQLNGSRWIKYDIDFINGSVIHVLITEPDKLGEAPSGTHEFAKGWIMNSTCNMIRQTVGYPTVWTELEIDSQTSRVLKQHKKAVLA